MPEFTTLILRFRDLATPPGTTIAEHKKIIADNKSVWWGWWNKHGETVPENAFRAINAQIVKSGAMDIYVFDTGQNRLHRAQLAGIDWNNQLQLIPTPDRQATPNYYGDSKYYAWFQLVEIDDTAIDEVELTKWSYVQVDEFFQTRKSIFEDFYNKQVSSFAELRSQDRTIWFIRPHRPGDPVHELRVYDQSRAAPKNYFEQIVRAHTNTLLWVSDPHFSLDHHDFPRDPGAMAGSNLSESIRQDLANNLGITTVGGLLISGDLTWKATDDEYDWAAKFIDDIKSWSTLTPSQILVCPGNHDLSFSAEPWDPDAPATEVGAPSSAAYRRFYERLFNVAPTDFMTSGRHFWLPDGQMVDIVSLNSSALQQYPGALQGQGFLGDPQLVEAKAGMGWSNERSRGRAFRICMIHHHVVPVLHREYPKLGIAASVVHDAGALIRWLVENEVDLVVPGHMHLPSMAKHSRARNYIQQSEWHEIIIAALGSAGVAADHRPNVPNSYGLLQFTREGVKLMMRSISADGSIPSEQRNILSTTIPYRN